MAETIIEYTTVPPEREDDPGCGCLTILIISAIVWAIVSIFVDGGVSCCFIIILVTIVILLYKLMSRK